MKAKSKNWQAAVAKKFMQYKTGNEQDAQKFIKNLLTTMSKELSNAIASKKCVRLLKRQIDLTPAQIHSSKYRGFGVWLSPRQKNCMLKMLKCQSNIRGSDI